LVSIFNFVRKKIQFLSKLKRRNEIFFFQVGTFSLAHDRQMVLGVAQHQQKWRKIKSTGRSFLLIRSRNRLGEDQQIKGNNI